MWTEYRLTPGVEYQAIPELRKSLLEEQGYVCAYCMRRIPVKDCNSDEKTRIEHILCRERHADLQLDYKNMVICCPGAINDEFHCDKLKGTRDVTFDLFSGAFINTLSYSSKDGKIKSSNVQYDREINEILNLNHPFLKKNRSIILSGIINQLNKKKQWKASELRKLLENWNVKDSEGQYKPYNGIVIWFLEKHLIDSKRLKSF